MTITLLTWIVVAPALAYGVYLTWPPPTTRARIRLAYVRWLDAREARHRIRINANVPDLYKAVREVVAYWHKYLPVTPDPVHQQSRQITDAVLAVLTRKR